MSTVVTSMTERQEGIVAILGVEGFVSVRDLVGHLGVSEMTVRRDLRALAAQDLVRLVHGGAALTHGTLRNPGFVTRASVESAAKRAIANAARAMVADGDTVAIDAGTTTYALAEALHDASPRSVVTNSIPVVQLYLGRPEQSVVVLGGDMIIESQAMVGTLAVEAARHLRASTLFLGAAAVDARGVYVETDAERPTKLAMMDSSDRVVLLCDASKFVVSAPVRLSGFDSIDLVISDERPSAAILRALDAASTELMVVGGAEAPR